MAHCFTDLDKSVVHVIRWDTGEGRGVDEETFVKGHKLPVLRGVSSTESKEQQGDYAVRAKSFQSCLTLQSHGQ